MLVWFLRCSFNQLYGLDNTGRAYLTLMLELHWRTVPSSSSHGSTTSAAMGNFYPQFLTQIRKRKKSINYNVSELPHTIITSYLSWFCSQRCTDMILHMDMAQAPLLPGLPDDLAIACLIWMILRRGITKFICRLSGPPD